MILSSHLGIKMTDKTPYNPEYPTDIEFDLLRQIRRFQFSRGFSTSTHAADFVFSTVSNAESAFQFFFSKTIFYY